MAYAFGHHVLPQAETLIGMVADTYRRWRNRHEFARFAQDNPAEVARMAQDLNIDKASLLAAIAQDSGTSEFLARRLRILGIDLEQIRKCEPAVARDLARCCALCDSKTRCGRDLARADHADWRTYCPNEPTIDALGPDFGASSHRD